MENIKTLLIANRGEIAVSTKLTSTHQQLHLFDLFALLYYATEAAFPSGHTRQTEADVYEHMHMSFVG